ncbi:MAG: hypothetical protein M3383_03040 [Actinomycetota bacterium]|nr:hypothetical protein [Actinomycetota bacterium]
MAAAAEEGGIEIPFEAFGVRAAVGASPPSLIESVRELLPPGWKPCAPQDVGKRFAIVADDMGTYEFVLNGDVINRGLELELALGMLDSQVRIHLGVKAPDSVFVHAGVVAQNGRTLVMPAMSFAGKTTLVAALVRAGATYYSDEFAVFDTEGLVHPYARPLSVRNEGEWNTHHPVESLGGTAGDEALPIGTIVITKYRPEAEWSPRSLSPGEGAMALLANAIPARERPDHVMRTLTRAAKSATVLEGERGEADAVANKLLETLAQPPPTP